MATDAAALRRCRLAGAASDGRRQRKAGRLEAAAGAVLQAASARRRQRLDTADDHRCDVLWAKRNPAVVVDAVLP